ncbi:hypothetical protein O159_03040 [Leifsonia xyli subsp. cynodontis DSM 46306]|uniref:Lysozyme n=1 Tax=Leifsonia xyli subsp. cynodontis DSM 46306 TaxID=1389489 RepID=U3P6I3_LEIXC|nr:GH25 family lysozyme [Leifsonia xyli]AGW40527.1 hypothetical protein O159_03040 [Leifsonia xyli subsp. cynodontis DSM 46306]
MRSGLLSALTAATLALGLGGSLSAAAAEPDRDGDPARDHSGSTLTHDDVLRVMPRSQQLTPAFAFLRGNDVSAWQPDVDWSDVVSKGAHFVYIKATEDDDYVSSQYEAQWTGAGDAGLYRGAYHFARPFWSDGASQAKHFMASIHGWKPGARLLPPMVDLEHRCSSLTQPWAIKKCQAMTPEDIVKWIHDFVSVVEQEAGVKPVIYTNPSWWKEYTGDITDFASYPLFIAHWMSDVSGGPGALPGGWVDWTLWQHWDDASGYTGPGDLLPGDQDLFHGTETALQRFSDDVYAAVTVSPSAVEPGGKVTVSGKGFAPKESVSVALGTAPGTTVTADGVGDFTAQASVPGDQPAGPLTVTAVGAESGASASGAVTVQALSPSPAIAPTVALSQPAPRPGTLFTATGSGFAASDAVTITLHSSPRVLGETAADASGAFAVALRLPADVTLGAHTLEFSGASGQTVQLPLTVEASPAVHSAAGSSSARVILADTGDRIDDILDLTVAMLGVGVIVLGLVRLRKRSPWQAR